MDVKKFLADKKMDFVESSGDDSSFWGGLDSIDDESFELFITSDQDGPTEKQIEIYHGFVESYKGLEKDIINRCRSLIPVDKQKKFEEAVVTLTFVSIHPEESEFDIDMIWSISAGWLFFSKTIDFFVQLKDSRIVNVEINE